MFEDGGIVQCVPEARRAWHAGESSWAGKTDINSHSIGIEIANPGHDYGYPDFPAAQVEAVRGPVLTIGGRGEAVRQLQAELTDYGYGIAATGLYDQGTAAVVAAFQRHFRPARVDGIADRSTAATLRALTLARDKAA